jgi:4a-hydroxytetrahydrobiopterin dehydratase
MALPGSGWYPCGMTTSVPPDVLDASAIEAALFELPGWRLAGGTLERDLRFPTFLDAIGAIDRIALIAEAQDHHPELLNVHRGLRIRLWSHDVGGVSARDVCLARAIAGVIAAADDPADD